MEPEDFEEIQDVEKEILERMVREREKIFTEGCNEGYELIKEHGSSCIDLADLDSAKSALQRMLGYFIQVEQYEKCSVIKKVFVEYFKTDPEPIFPNFDPTLDNE
jgi:hypothetical protein